MLKGVKRHHGDKARIGSRGETGCSGDTVQPFIKENVNPDISNAAVKGFTRNSFNGY